MDARRRRVLSDQMRLARRGRLWRGHFEGTSVDGHCQFCEAEDLKILVSSYDRQLASGAKREREGAQGQKEENSENH